MRFEIISSEKDLFGVYTVEVKLNGRLYIYKLTSQYDYDKAMGYYRRGHFGKALNVLRGIR